MDLRTCALAAVFSGFLAGSLAAQEAPRLFLYPLETPAAQDPAPVPRAAPSDDFTPVPQFPPPSRLPPPFPPPPPPPPRISERFEVRFEYGLGEMEHETRGSSLDGETDARFVRLQLEGCGYGGIGGGLRIEGIASDDDLFEEVAGDDISASMGEIFLYVAVHLGDERLRFPLRAGLSYHELVIDDELLDLEVEYASFAFRFEGEPELRLVAGDSLCWSAYSLFGMGFGGTEIETDPSTVDDEASSAFFAFELGTRLEWGPALFGVGYIYRLTDIDEGDDFYFGIENEFSGLLLTLGLRF